jgi:hypothetical protein
VEHWRTVAGGSDIAGGTTSESEGEVRGPRRRRRRRRRRRVDQGDRGGQEPVS